MSYLRNTWYVAGWDEELGGDKLLSRRILDEPLVHFRDGRGVPQALTDRCPHRFAPLSLGGCGWEIQHWQMLRPSRIFLAWIRGAGSWASGTSA